MTRVHSPEVQNAIQVQSIEPQTKTPTTPLHKMVQFSAFRVTLGLSFVSLASYIIGS